LALAQKHSRGNAIFTEKLKGLSSGSEKASSAADSALGSGNMASEN